MDAIEDYARTWAKQEEVEVDTLSEWVKSIKTLIKRRLYMLSKTMSTKTQSVFADHEVNSTLNGLHDKYVVVPADKAANNVVVICKSYYYQCLVKLMLNPLMSALHYLRKIFCQTTSLSSTLMVLR